MLVAIIAVWLAAWLIRKIFVDLRKTDEFISAFRGHNALFNKIYEMKCDPETPDSEFLELLPVAEWADQIYENALQRSEMDTEFHRLTESIVSWVVPEVA